MTKACIQSCMILYSTLIYKVSYQNKSLNSNKDIYHARLTEIMLLTFIIVLKTDLISQGRSGERKKEDMNLPISPSNASEPKKKEELKPTDTEEKMETEHSKAKEQGNICFMHFR